STRPERAQSRVVVGRGFILGRGAVRRSAPGPLGVAFLEALLVADPVFENRPRRPRSRAAVGQWQCGDTATYPTRLRRGRGPRSLPPTRLMPMTGCSF